MEGMQKRLQTELEKFKSIQKGLFCFYTSHYVNVVDVVVIFDFEGGSPFIAQPFMHVQKGQEVQWEGIG